MSNHLSVQLLYDLDVSMGPPLEINVTHNDEVAPYDHQDGELHQNNDEQNQEDHNSGETSIQRSLRQAVHIPTSQQLAQKMLASHGINEYGNNYNNDNRQALEDEQRFANYPDQQLRPPWETLPISGMSNMSKKESKSQPKRRLKAPLPLHPTQDIIESDNIDVEQQHLIDAYNDSNTPTQQQQEQQQQQPHISSPCSKSVTFQTKDETYCWDEGLDVLKYVDSEFFAVAHFLIDVVGVDGANDYLLEHQDQQTEMMKNQKKQREGDNKGGGCGGNGLFKLLFGCGTLEIGEEVFNFNENEGFHPKKNELQEALYRQHQQQQQQQQQEQQEQQQSRKNMEYQLTIKLVNDFATAVKYRMENIEAAASSQQEIQYNDDVVIMTKEVSRKMYAYGLPLIGMVPRPNRDDDYKENDNLAALDDDLACMSDKAVDENFVSHSDLGLFSAYASLCVHLIIRISICSSHRWIHFIWADRIIVNSFLFCLPTTTMMKMTVQMRMTSLHPIYFTTRPRRR